MATGHHGLEVGQKSVNHMVEGQWQQQKRAAKFKDLYQGRLLVRQKGAVAAVAAAAAAAVSVLQIPTADPDQEKRLVSTHRANIDELLRSI